MWADFHRSGDRMDRLEATTVSGDRMCVFGTNSLNELWWCRQTSRLSLWTNWAKVALRDGPDFPIITQFAAGVGSHRQPILFCQTATPFKGATLHLLSLMPIGDGDTLEEWGKGWTHRAIPLPAGIADISTIYVFGNDSAASLYVIDRSGRTYRSTELPQPNGDSGWTDLANLVIPSSFSKLASPHSFGSSGTLLFARDTINQIWRSTQMLGELWSSWELIAPWTTGIFDIASATDGFGMNHIYGMTTNGRIVHSREKANDNAREDNWTPFEDIGFEPEISFLQWVMGIIRIPKPVLKIRLCVDDNKRIQIIVHDNNGKLFQSWQKNIVPDLDDPTNSFSETVGKHTKFLPLNFDEDRFRDFAVVTDPAKRIHLFVTPKSDRTPQHAVIWGYRIHIRLVTTRDDWDVPERRAESTTTYEQFSDSLTNVNYIFRNSGIQFVCDPKADWVEIANTNINRESFWVSQNGKSQIDYAKQFPDSIVIFNRYGHEANRTGVSYSGGPESGGRYVAMTTVFDPVNFNAQSGGIAHEVGHYLGLDHTFAFPPKYPKREESATLEEHIRKVDQLLITTTLKGFGPNALETDFDRSSGVFDTPFDPHPDYYSARFPDRAGGDIAGDAAVTVKGEFAGQHVEYDIAPDTDNAMSYYGGGHPVTQVPPPWQNFSPDQIIRMHQSLRHLLRMPLLRPPVI